MSSVRSEEDDIEKATDEIRDLEDEMMRKTSLLQRFTQALFTFNTPESSTEEEPQVSEVKDEKPVVKPGSSKLNHSFLTYLVPRSLTFSYLQINKGSEICVAKYPSKGFWGEPLEGGGGVSLRRGIQQ